MRVLFILMQVVIWRQERCLAFEHKLVLAIFEIAATVNLSTMRNTSFARYRQLEKSSLCFLLLCIPFKNRLKVDFGQHKYNRLLCNLRMPQ